MLQAFIKEVGLMQRLDHPNVLGLIGMCIGSGGTLAMVTEFLSLGSVFSLLHSKKPPAPLPRHVTLRMLADTARGMAYLHSCDPTIIHRDLKSQNLLVSEDHVVKVADFGLSREYLQPAAMTRVGSVQWAAPEVLLGQSYSYKADLWSFGVVCWEMLTAQIPFEKMSQHVVATRVAMEGMRLPVPSRAPPLLLRLIARCWSDTPSHRPDFPHVINELDEMIRVMDARMARGESSAASSIASSSNASLPPVSGAGSFAGSYAGSCGNAPSPQIPHMAQIPSQSELPPPPPRPTVMTAASEDSAI
uniref:Protein kinase domain-containing protein n=1 Tax=Haptolina ericina TaxID=156174 RepID=A0A7S3APK2_9EUKA